MFDIVRIMVAGGSGGDGAITFRREKYVPFGGPDGGDGGNGGDVVIEAAPAVTSLRELRQGGQYRAKHGENGRRQKQSGRRGGDLVLKVPVGTLVQAEEGTGAVFVADLAQAGEKATVCKGGRGGKGNVHYASSTNQVPRLAQVGEKGEQRHLVLEMRLIADAGIIGYPNAGKSSLLARVSRAKPAIGDYPFTTREPVVGVVEMGHEAFTVAEIPGLIAGAHLGRGLGHDFLRHSTRTRVFIHLVDGTASSPVEAMIQVNNELSLYDTALGRKPQVVAVNKIDLPEVRARMPAVKSDFETAGVPVLFISAVTGEGLTALLEAVRQAFDRVPVRNSGTTPQVFCPQPRRTYATVRREGDIFVVSAPDIERVTARVDTADPLVKGQLLALLERKGIGRMLAKAGIRRGDKLRCGDAVWEW